MNGDFEAEDDGSDSRLLSDKCDNEGEVLSDPSDEYHPPTLAAYRIDPNLRPSIDSCPSPVRFMTSYSGCTNTTIVRIAMDWSDGSTAGRADTTTHEEPESDHGHLDMVVSGTDSEISDVDKEERDGSTSSQSDIDDTKSTMKHASQLREGREDVDWSELSSARAALQSSDDESSSRDDDDDTQSWTDDEEPELRHILADSSPDMNNSDEYEEERPTAGDDEKYDNQPQETRGTNNFIVNENGTFEEVCLSSSTYYFHCSDKAHGGDSC